MKYPDDFDDLYIEDEQDLDNFEPAVQVGCLLHALEAEVNNGGFDQFFLNSSGRYARQTLDALKAIGATHTVELLNAAIATAYPEGYPDNPDEHEDTSDADDALNKLSELDDRFLEYRDPLTDLVNRFIAQHS